MKLKILYIKISADKQKLQDEHFLVTYVINIM